MREGDLVKLKTKVGLKGRGVLKELLPDRQWVVEISTGDIETCKEEDLIKISPRRVDDLHQD